MQPLFIFVVNVIGVMYIKELEITNIRSIKKLRMTFQNPAGWHVLLGENGSGKSSIVRAISAALVGPSEILRLDPDFGSWVTVGEKEAMIELKLQKGDLDRRAGKGGSKKGAKSINEIECITKISQQKDNGRNWYFTDNSAKKTGDHPSYYNWGAANGWFSAAFGAYRRFTGGDQSLDTFYVRNPKIGAHLTAFKENAALTETVVWLKDLQFRALSNARAEENMILESIRHFINKENLLPDGFKLKEITPDGPMFTIPGDGAVHLYELSEGIKSVASLTFELIRLLLLSYSAQSVFGQFMDNKSDNDFIPVDGVVLIDEIDAHLHPTWQARVGQWFTRYFPNIQFIVTTHSPLVCRASVKGSVWRLPAPYEEEEPQQIKGVMLNRLLYGDILDALGTGAFGDGITRDRRGLEKLERLAKLNQLYYKGKLTPMEQEERWLLMETFPVL